MKYCVLDARWWPRTKLPDPGAAWVRHLGRRNNVSLIARPEEADCILISCSAIDYFPAVRAIRRRFPKAKIVLGGFAAYFPLAIEEHCDLICVGEGLNFLRTLWSQGWDAAAELPETWIPGRRKIVVPSEEFDWTMPPIERADGYVQLPCGRGCKRRCLFCQVGWSRRYEEHPRPDELVYLAHRVRRTGKSLLYLSNDLSQHSFFRRLPPTTFGSYSYAYLSRLSAPPRVRCIRIGVEGVSERLRRAAGKPIPRDELVKMTAWLTRHHRQVQWFLIAGLPGETDEDYEELKEDLAHWREATSDVKGCLLLDFTAFSPQPAAPFSVLPLDDSYWRRFEAFRDWYFKRGWSRRILVGSPKQPKGRLKDAMIYMGHSERDLRRGGKAGQAGLIRWPHKWPDKFRQMLNETQRFQRD